MEDHLLTPEYRQTIIFLATAALLVPAFQHIRVSPILGFLLAGLLLGPHGVAVFADRLPWLSYIVFDDSTGVRTLAELGVVFLLFVIGLELSYERLWSLRRLVFGYGSAQVALTALTIGLIAWFWGNSPTAAIVVGMSLALSSTALVVQGLIERGAFGSPIGRAAFAVLLFQDLMVVPILFVVSTFGGDFGGSAWTGLATSLIGAVVVITAILALGRLAIRPLFHLVASTRSPDLFVAMTLLLVIACALGTAAVGLSMALGAFLAGLMLSDSEFRHQIEADIEPFKGLLLGLFFMSVGMTIDVVQVADRFLLLAASVMALLALKVVVALAASRLARLPLVIGAPTAVMLAQGGEFAFVTLGLATMLDVVPFETAQFMILVAALTMMVTPLLISAALRLGRAMEHRDHRVLAAEADGAETPSGHVVIAGFGRVGRAIARMLDDQGIPYRAIDSNGNVVARDKARGVAVFYGDARRHEILERLGIRRANALLVTLDEADAALRTVAAGRHANPSLKIFARARDVPHARALTAAGADHVVPEIAESSLELAERAFEAIGLPPAQAKALSDRIRSEGYQDLDDRP